MNKELLILILAPIIVFIWLWYQDKKNKKEIKQQERLNQIR